MKRMDSPLHRAAWLGSAQHGVEAWWRERLSALALLPLTVWFVGALLAHTGAPYHEVIGWLRTPYVALLLVLLLSALFYHAALGLQVVIEDYIHHAGAKMAALMVVRFACTLLAIMGILAVVRIEMNTS